LITVSLEVQVTVRPKAKATFRLKVKASFNPLIWFPRKYITVEFEKGSPVDSDAPAPSSFKFSFHGCNCGKKTKRRFRSPVEVPGEDGKKKSIEGDETGRLLV